jgi:CRP/FNR family transcriptional regulator, cyclic AMP receptor protein
MKPDTSFSLLTGNNFEPQLAKAGDIIFREGDEARELFVIKRGEFRSATGRLPSFPRTAFSARWR